MVCRRAVANDERSSPDVLLTPPVVGVVDVGVVSLPMGGVNDELVVRPANISSDGAACMYRCSDQSDASSHVTYRAGRQSSTTRGQHCFM